MKELEAFTEHLPSAYDAPVAGGTAISKMANIPVPVKPKRNTQNQCMSEADRVLK